MSADFLSGLLLTAVAVAGLVYIVKEWFDLGLPSPGAEKREEPSGAGGTNAHLIGAIGRVVEAGEPGGEMRVRVGMERWSARLRSPGGTALPVGAEVEVKAVDGLVLEVVERSAPAEAAEQQESAER